MQPPQTETRQPEPDNVIEQELINVHAGEGYALKLNAATHYFYVVELEEDGSFIVHVRPRRQAGIRHGYPCT